MKSTVLGAILGAALATQALAEGAPNPLCSAVDVDEEVLFGMAQVSRGVEKCGLTPSPAVSLGMFGLVTIAAMCGKIDASNVHSIQVKAFDEFDHVMEQYGKDAACEAIKLKLKQAEAKLSKASD
jgi:hypothetical protein